MGNKIIDVWQRVGVLLAIKGGSESADEMGLTLDGVSTILERYPDVSAEWLMRGTGSMYRSARDGEVSATYNLDVSRHRVEGSGNVLTSGQSAGGVLADAVGRISVSLERMTDALCRLDRHNERRGQHNNGGHSNEDGYTRPAL